MKTAQPLRDCPVVILSQNKTEGIIDTTGLYWKGKETDKDSIWKH